MNFFYVCEPYLNASGEQRVKSTVPYQIMVLMPSGNVIIGTEEEMPLGYYMIPKFENDPDNIIRSYLNWYSANPGDIPQILHPE
jgi:hypothetical protein